MQAHAVGFAGADAAIDTGHRGTSRDRCGVPIGRRAVRRRLPDGRKKWSEVLPPFLTIGKCRQTTHNTDDANSQPPPLVPVQLADAADLLDRVCDRVWDVRNAAQTQTEGARGR